RSNKGAAMSVEQEAHKQTLAGFFSRAAADYDQVGFRYFSDFGKRLVELAHIAPGSTILDVAAGRGAVLLPAAAHTGRNGHVTGIDLADGMVSQLAADIAARGMQNAEALLMDAEALKFPDDTFDYVLSGFSLAFLPNLLGTLAEFRRVLKPGGWFATSSWGQDDERWVWVGEIDKKYASPSLQGGPSRDWSAFRTPAALTGLLNQAGYNDIRVSVEEKQFSYGDPDKWLTQMGTMGKRRLLETMTSAAYEAWKAEVFLGIEKMRTTDGIRHALRVVYSVARNP